MGSIFQIQYPYHHHLETGKNIDFKNLSWFILVVGSEFLFVSFKLDA